MVNWLAQGCTGPAAKQEVTFCSSSPEPLDFSPAPWGQVLRRQVLVSGGHAAWALFKCSGEKSFSFLASVFRASTLNYANVWHGIVPLASPWQWHFFQARLQRAHFAVLSRVWSDLFYILGLKQEIRCPHEPFLTVATQGLPRSFPVWCMVPLFGVYVKAQNSKAACYWTPS